MAVIEVRRQVFDAANALKTLAGVRGGDAYSYAVMIGDFHERHVGEILWGGSVDDEEKKVAGADDVQFWQDVCEYLMRMQHDMGETEIKVID